MTVSVGHNKFGQTPPKITSCKYRASVLKLTAWSRVLLEKLTGSQLLKKFPEFYGTRRFITAFTSARHLSLCDPDRYSPCTICHFLKIHLNIILPSKPVSFKWLFPSDFPTKTLYTFLFSPKGAARPALLIRLDFITRIIMSEEYISLSSSFCSFKNHTYQPDVYKRVTK